MTEERDTLGVHIGAREIYDEVIGLREDMRSMTQNSASLRAEVEDHEARIRDLERWRYALPLAAVSGILAAGISIAQAVGKG